MPPAAESVHQATMAMATRTCMGSSFTTQSLPFLVLLMTTIFSVAPPVAGEPPSVVPYACKEATAAGGGTFTEDFCLSTLDGSKSAGAADYADLALIAVDLAMANATATEAKIEALLAGNNGGDSGGATSEGLQSCRALYDTVLRQYQPECRAAVNDGRYGDRKACLGRTAQAAAACERWFQERKVASPVAQEDDVLAKLANLAIALASIA